MLFFFHALKDSTPEITSSEQETTGKPDRKLNSASVMMAANNHLCLLSCCIDGLDIDDAFLEDCEVMMLLMLSC